MPPLVGSSSPYSIAARVRRLAAPGFAALPQTLPYPSRPAGTARRVPPAARRFEQPEESDMGLERVPAGAKVPDEINVIIEIPKDAEPVKYEVDKASGAIFVDRVLSTPMRYPCNYGYVPHTLGGDGDPLDALVILPLPLVPGSVIRCRPVGMLRMTDEAGADEKLVVVPHAKIFAGYAHIADIGQVSGHWLERIGHFFEHYKDLEKGKWVKLEGWADAAAAKAEINAGVERYESSAQKPAF
jgi:inorganic pyrophosphatase